MSNPTKGTGESFGEEVEIQGESCRMSRSLPSREGKESLQHKTNGRGGMSKDLRTLMSQWGCTVRRGGEWGQVIENIPQLG